MAFPHYYSNTRFLASEIRKDMPSEEVPAHIQLFHLLEVIHCLSQCGITHVKIFDAHFSTEVLNHLLSLGYYINVSNDDNSLNIDWGKILNV